MDLCFYSNTQNPITFLFIMIWVAPFICLEMSKYSLNLVQYSIQNLTSSSYRKPSGKILPWVTSSIVFHSCLPRFQSDFVKLLELLEMRPPKAKWLNYLLVLTLFNVTLHLCYVYFLLQVCQFFNSDQKDIFCCPSSSIPEYVSDSSFRVVDAAMHAHLVR